MRKLYKELLVFALVLADAAAGQIMPYYLNCAVDIKPVGSSPPRYNKAPNQVPFSIKTWNLQNWGSRPSFTSSNPIP